ncbi:MAG: dephospho-CoA kinase [Phycisphaeraceae bacterium]|nr:dephospho-CoA kinase [Phycisphaeraceae bacterium]
MMTLTKRKPVIGLAGGIGSGKSWIAAQLRKLGCGVISADDLARKALDEPEVIRAVLDRWGLGVLNDLDRIDRGKVASQVFNDLTERRFLESLIHPRVHEGRRKLRTDMNADPGVVAIVEDCPLLFESGLNSDCDAVIFVDAPLEIRRKRVKAQRGWDAEELERREKTQLPLDTKAARADHTIANGSDEATVSEELRGILTRILSSA